MMKLEYGEAVGIGSQTLIGVDMSEFPIKRGNCFSVYVKRHTDVNEENEEVRVVNFGVENLEKLLEIGVLEWPVRIAFLDEKQRIGIIHDERIPTDWYDQTYCDVCCPDRLLPLPQQAMNDIRERAGYIFRNESIVKYNFPMQKKEAERVRALANGEEWDSDEYDNRPRVFCDAGLTVWIYGADHSDSMVSAVEEKVSSAVAKVLHHMKNSDCRDLLFPDMGSRKVSLTLEFFQDSDHDLAKARFLYPVPKEKS